tara:strand:- start:60 stop:560 length:501 start_codon:yes stop_codon:yes gene_type:complete
MWIIAKYKINELAFLKNKFKEILGNEPEYFIPEIKYNKIIKKKFKTFKKSILEGYLICFHSKFNNKEIINNLRYTRGLKCILEGFKNSQDEISNFIERCKNYEDKDGFINQDFFSDENFNKGKFVSGPFTSLIFEVLSKQSDKIEILIGKYKTTISKKSNFLYRPI